MRDADAARLSDLEELDTSALRIARQQLHQACGALEMVGVTAPAQVLRSMEAAVNRFVQRPEYCTQEAATTLERTHFALMEFLEAVLAGQQVSAVALFPQYRETQMLAGNAKTSGQLVHARNVLAQANRMVEERMPDRLPPAAREQFFEQLALLKLTIADAEEGAAAHEEFEEVAARPAPVVDPARLREVAA